MILKPLTEAESIRKLRRVLEKYVDLTSQDVSKTDEDGDLFDEAIQVLAETKQPPLPARLPVPAAPEGFRYLGDELDGETTYQLRVPLPHDDTPHSGQWLVVVVVIPRPSSGEPISMEVLRETELIPPNKSTTVSLLQGDIANEHALAAVLYGAARRRAVTVFEPVLTEVRNDSYGQEED